MEIYRQYKQTAGHQLQVHMQVATGLHVTCFSPREHGERGVILGLVSLSFIGSLRLISLLLLCWQVPRGQWAAVHTEEVWLDGHRLHQLPELLGRPHGREGGPEAHHDHAGVHRDALPLLLPASPRLHDCHTWSVLHRIRPSLLLTNRRAKWDRGVSGVGLCHQGLAHVLWISSLISQVTNPSCTSSAAGQGAPRRGACSPNVFHQNTLAR